MCSYVYFGICVFDVNTIATIVHSTVLNSAKLAKKTDQLTPKTDLQVIKKIFNLNLKNTYEDRFSKENPQAVSIHTHVWWGCSTFFLQNVCFYF